MPRIDPLQLLKCLSVLLSPEGGILSRDEVPRLVNLMTKFSKKLVSKCVYVLILKNTETSLVDMFMAEGGWTLIQTWLQDAAPSGNWDLVKEILGLLLITPVDVERLKMNCLPKLIKNLSRREDLGDVAILSNQIVQNWLIIVKGSAHGQVAAAPPPVKIQPEIKEPEVKPPPVETKENEELNTVGTSADSADSPEQPEEVNDKDDDTAGGDNSISTSTFYKVSVKDGKQVIKRLSTESNKTSNESEEPSQDKESRDSKGVDKDSKSVEKKKEKSSKSSSKSKSSSSSRDKDKKKSSSHSSSSTSKSKSSTSKDKEKEKDRKDKDKERDRREKEKDRTKSSSSSKSSSKSGSSSSKDKKDSKDKNRSNDSKGSKDLKDVKDAREIKDSNENKDSKEVKDPKETKEKQAEKDKDTLEKLKPQTLDKLGRIPKKSSSVDEKQKENKGDNKSAEPEKKKPSFSILNRKATGEERSKTVKVFNSKMRSTGLEEEVKPPPPRSANKKPNPSVQLPTIPPKRPSPPREPSSIMPPEKKLKIDKIDIPERPGAIKLIPPKPKPAVLQESDMFMDALTASAPKKETKKRKRRLSVTKETPSSPSSSPVRADAQIPASPTPSSPTSALGLKNIAPINFYQDTLSEETEKSEGNANEATTDGNEKVNENSSNSPETVDTPASPPTNTDADVAIDTDDAPVPPKQIKLDGGLKGVLLYSKKKGPKRSIQWKAEESLVEIRYFELDETERVNVTKPFMDMAKMELSSEREALIMSRKLANEDVMEPQIMWRMPYICDQPEPLALPGSKSLEKDIQFAREKSVLPALYFDKRRIPDSPEEPIPENHQMSDPVIIPLEDPESQEIDLKGTPWPEPKGPAPQLEPQPMPPMFQNMPFNPAFNNMGNMPPTAPFVGAPPRFAGPPGPHGPMPPGPGNFGPPNMMHNNMMVPPMNQPDMMNHPGPMNPAMFAPGPEGYMGPGNDPNYSIPQFNGPQGPNMNVYSGPNNFNHRGGGGRGGGYRRGGNNGGWVQLNGPRNWKRGGGGSRGGRLCKNIQNHGYCRNGDNCPFVH